MMKFNKTKRRKNIHGRVDLESLRTLHCRPRTDHAGTTAQYEWTLQQGPY
ncbi:hypothetical protein SERLADRAFT_457663 [Serpula lacrymans var. lacrymans S7.9]|uniref:Uncharacterized protein n=1 Tax=Serpula lacrymans var. lacrymans (strain S7.9) TaxID=578457 RepID=F8NGZ9_SERL9|nr:uncharacterized protein SERLADRAFT_457663 [Serpula lacrymans var. lacrymans S7.9]EGO29641.1 hypothetical protein SERLADRAFT_457663 [Serpula lacrymans var. lacrymans S7.9]